MTHAFAGELLARVADPEGDVRFTSSAEYSGRGTDDLDLLGLKVSRDEKGFWFTASFKAAIRDPRDFVRSVSSESLGDFARKGFYRFNIDVYVDTDRMSGSGNTFTLPGRHADVGAAFAWERAVILTPRPELMRHQLLEALHKLNPAYSSEEIAAAIDQSIIFPVRVKVHGKSVDFFVPAEFFSGSDGKNWALTAFVTAATIDVPSDFSMIDSGKPALERLHLGVMQQAASRAPDIAGEVVDALDGSSRRSSAEPIRELPGVAWGSAAVAETASKGSADTSGLSLARLFGAQGESPVTIPTPPQVDAPAGDSITDRLQTLRKLLDDGFIDESEYKQQRARILDTM